MAPTCSEVAQPARKRAARQRPSGPADDRRESFMMVWERRDCGFAGIDPAGGGDEGWVLSPDGGIIRPRRIYRAGAKKHLHRGVAGRVGAPVGEAKVSASVFKEVAYVPPPCPPPPRRRRVVTERWQSGRSRLTRNQVGRKVPGVRIPPSPPPFAPAELRVARPIANHRTFVLRRDHRRRVPHIALAKWGMKGATKAKHALRSFSVGGHPDGRRSGLRMARPLIRSCGASGGTATREPPHVCPAARPSAEGCPT
jgi:hypothetical protein